MKPKKKNATTSPKIRFGVIGLGHIAQVAVLPAFAHAKKDVELAALISSDAKKLATLKKKYKVPLAFSYEQFDACLDSGAIDALYIALPNTEHADYAERALKKGVHVLCEKPLAMTEKDCARLIKAAEKNNVKLMTAYRLHFDGANLKAIHVAKERLGELRFFNSSFSYQIEDQDNIRLRKEEGGPLWDIGIYCLNAARYFFRAEPTEVTALSAAGDSARFREVPETVAVSMKFPKDRLASFVVSFGSEASASYEVVGTKGRLRLEAAYEYAYPREMEVVVNYKTQNFRFKKVDQFAPELIYFANCIRENREPEPSGLEGLADVRILLAIEESLRRGKAVSLATPAALIRKARPKLKQAMRRPPVSEPRVVDVDAPSGS